eukprot:TRINITY_DN21162_c0_g2_i1.p1 TRINITY_DN21162_c0_g2~~TRINITY_DN21162_c0_g2_i1.p1  ORF type:complete len:798 (-),score=264.82 TRINITY_DN21162_c0_g2_i1:43-2304(-)
MAAELKSEAEADEKANKELSCWCTSTRKEKNARIDNAKVKIPELESKIDVKTVEKAQIAAIIKDFEKQVEDGKEALSQAETIRDEQHSKYVKYEQDTSTYLSNLKAAVTVLEDKTGLPALPQVSQFVNLMSSLTQQPSLLQLGSEAGVESQQSESDMVRSLDDFMRHHGMPTGSEEVLPESSTWKPSQQLAREQEREREEALTSQRSQRRSAQKFLQKDSADDLALIMDHAAEASKSQSTSTRPRLPDANGWSTEDKAAIQNGLSAAMAFLQSARVQTELVSPGGIGELIGMLKQMTDTMGDELKEAKEKEDEEEKEYSGLRIAKLEEIREAENELVVKEAAHAYASEALALAKEEVKQERTSVKNEQAALAEMEKTCLNGEHNYQQRFKARAEEREAVSQAMEALAEQATSTTFNFLQLSKESGGREAQSTRQAAARLLRDASTRLQDSEAVQLSSGYLEALASSAEIDSFTKVKEAIDNLVGELKRKQELDDKKQDRCKKDLFENARDMEKAVDHQSSLEIKLSQMESDLELVEKDLNEKKAERDELNKELAVAGNDRQKEHADFQKTYWGQKMTAMALKKAHDKLSAVYTKSPTESLIQIEKEDIASSQPNISKNYEKNGMGGSVLTLLESLIGQADELMKDAAQAETQAQASYVKLSKNTADVVHNLEIQITTKSRAVVNAKKEIAQTRGNINLSIKEQTELTEQKNNIKMDCDFLLNNFAKIANARAQEQEALKQAKSVLSGASLPQD